MANNGDITPKIILMHIHAMQKSLHAEMHAMRDDLTKRIDAADQKLDNRFSVLSVQIQNIDQRLDGIEIENLPKRVRKLEKAAFAR